MPRECSVFWVLGAFSTESSSAEFGVLTSCVGLTPQLAVGCSVGMEEVTLGPDFVAAQRGMWIGGVLPAVRSVQASRWLGGAGKLQLLPSALTYS